MDTMYPGKVNSPASQLSSGIGAADATIPVDELGNFPDAPNEATLGVDEDAETILYAGKSASSGAGNLTGCTRGFQGTSSEWPAGTTIARRFTAYDYDTLRTNLEATGSSVDGGAAGTEYVTSQEIDGGDANG